MYSVLQQSLINSPLPPAVLLAKLDYSVRVNARTSAGTGPKSGVTTMDLDLSKNEAVEFLDLDSRKGPHRIPILVPQLAINLTPIAQVVPLNSSSHARLIQVELTNNSPSSIEGDLTLKPPSGWIVEPTQRSFSISRESETAVFRFEVKSAGTLSPGKACFEATARTKGKSFWLGYQIISVMDLWKIPLYLFRNQRHHAGCRRLCAFRRISHGPAMRPETLSQLGQK
jgi:hypothetical protein